MNIGIIGVGFVGNAILKSLEKHNFIIDKNLFIYDKYKTQENISNNINNLFNTDIIFLCLPTPFLTELNKYDITSIEKSLDILNKNNYQGLCLLKSTVTPLTTYNLSKQFRNIKLIHNPEFLSAKTAEEDFHNQKHIVLGLTDEITKKDLELVTEFYKKLYTNNISILSSTESELMKLTANCFYSVKIQYFTEIFLMCNKLDCSYNLVRDSLLKNNWVNPMHTIVPGSDGKLSYGGLCFPKDTLALNEFMIYNNFNNNVLQATIEERNKMRNDNDNII
jgi:UDPglucose 6-dehydrogenase